MIINEKNPNELLKVCPTDDVNNFRLEKRLFDDYLPNVFLSKLSQCGFKHGVVSNISGRKKLVLKKCQNTLICAATFLHKIVYVNYQFYKTKVPLCNLCISVMITPWGCIPVVHVTLNNDIHRSGKAFLS